MEEVSPGLLTWLFMKDILDLGHQGHTRVILHLGERQEGSDIRSVYGSVYGSFLTSPSMHMAR